MPQKKASELIFVGDPMCSWCYAFGPELQRVLDRTGLPLRLVMGGLFTGDRTLPLGDDLRRYLMATWGRVSSSSGRPVDYRPLDWQGWTYDTEPACRAVVTLRHLQPDAALPFFDRVQAAFYADAVDVTSPAAYADLVDGLGIDPSEFANHMASDAMVDATASDFAEAQLLGVHGFPTLLLDVGTEHIVVAPGYVLADRVIRSIGVLTG